MKISAIPQLYRNLRRWREILAVLRRYGLADWFSQYERFPLRGFFKDPSGTPLAEYSREQRVRMALTDLGPTFIKLGQVLAGRPDLTGPELGEELKRLRANVRADSIETVQKTLAAELGEDYQSHFASIDPKPLATASIGQVHRARLKDGRRVVIKVQRAGIEKTVREDIEVLSGLAVLAERVEALAAWGPSDVANQLAPMITRELNFDRERQSLEHFAHWIAKNHPQVVVPVPVTSLCTRRVLVMDEMVGHSLEAYFGTDDACQPDTPTTSTTSAPSPSTSSRPANGRVKDTEGEPGKTDAKSHTVIRSKQELATLDAGTKQRLSETLAEVYLGMIFDQGLFHADPHPGNLFLLDDGRLGILDFGMTGRIDEMLRENIEDMLVAVGRADQNRLVRLIRRVGSTPPTLDESALAIDVADFVATYGKQSLGGFDLTGALNELTAILHRHSIKLPNQSALVLKMLISLEGTLCELGASFDSLEVVRSLARKIALRRISPKRRLRQAQRIYLEAESFLETAPDEAISLIQQIRRGDIKLSLDHQRLSPSVNRLVLGMMTSAVFLGSSLMMAFNVPPLLFTETEFMGMQNVSLLGILGVGGSISVMSWLLLAIGRSGHLTRNNDD
ncbi:ABC1 kinase family protein [Stieleria varia]|uniref:Protein kinase domain-containing protein n=1 Tax=Stieleria varia TaxID=2528005 RepID=A0A5C6B043_9BACT|nr:AarF/UbiB family protein [Stieleria varia]TWU05583.1 putative protein kinase UbiB [Stieleria varia]